MSEQGFKQYVAAGTQLDGTEDKGLFTELLKARSQGGKVTGIYVDLGAGADKSVAVEYRAVGGVAVTLATVAGLATGITSYSLFDTVIPFAAGDTIAIITTNAAGPITAIVMVD